MSLKRELTREEVASVVAPLGDAVRVETLSGGLFASVARVDLAHGDVIAVKSSPPPGSSALLSYETDVLSAEIEVLELGRSHRGLRLPELLLVDRTRSVIEVDVIATSFLPGTRWDTAAMHPSATARAHRELGHVLASYHQVVGGRFGYVTDRVPQYAGTEWADVFRAMILGLVDDGEAAGLDLRRVRMLRAVDLHLNELATVKEPRLVHGDLWAGNTFVDPTSGVITGVIDPERALWGDPLFDLAGTDQVSLEDPPGDLLDGLAQGGQPLVLDDGARARLTLYRLWFALAMLAEGGPRGHLFDRSEWDATLWRQAESLLEALGA